MYTSVPILSFINTIHVYLHIYSNILFYMTIYNSSVSLSIHELQERAGVSDGVVVLFLHLKKCGGMTIQDILRKTYNNHNNIGHASEEMRWFFDYPAERIEQWTEELYPHTIIADHFPYGFHILVSPRPYVYITMLRKPRPRLISYYNYLRVATDWEHPCLIQEEGGGVKEGRAFV